MEQTHPLPRFPASILSPSPPPAQTSWRSWHTPQCCPHSEPSRLPIAFQMGSEVHSRLPSHCPSDELLGLCLCWWPCPRRSSTSISLARSWTCAGPWAVQAGASTAQCSWALRPVQWPGPDRGCKAGCRDWSALPGPGPPSRSAHPPAQPGKALSAPEVSFSGNSLLMPQQNICPLPSLRLHGSIRPQTSHSREIPFVLEQ